MMFTPQKVWSGWRGDEKGGDSNPSSSHKNKGFAIGDSTPKGLVSPTLGLWIKMLSLIELIASKRSSMNTTNTTMGLLLIEKKEWTSKNEQFEQSISRNQGASSTRANSSSYCNVRGGETRRKVKKNIRS
ncbi:hypothetical protein Hdeb2414_s0167g00820801 [Helianthus debilis subsp. tardiflorus]